MDALFATVSAFQWIFEVLSTERSAFTVFREIESERMGGEEREANGLMYLYSRQTQERCNYSAYSAFSS